MDVPVDVPVDVPAKVTVRTMTESAFADVRLRGALIEPTDDAYDQARTTWNGLADRRPAVIIRCMDAADVALAVAFAREHSLAVAIRSGGHSIAGHSTCDAGVVIDLSPMKDIDIDPIQRVMRVEAGLTWGEVAVATQPYGLAITAGDTGSVGVGGLTLGGGIGWQVRKHGLTIDNLRVVELVTADSRFVRASATENAELFWGVRGGGGNFGVVTAFEFDLHPAGIVLGGAIFYDPADAENVLREYARLAAAAPDELTTQLLMMPAPAAPFMPPERQGRPVIAILLCYSGELGEGERVVAPLRHLAAPITDLVGPMPYAALFALAAEGEVRGMRHQVRSLLLRTFDEGVLSALVSSVATISPATIVQLRSLGGAVGRVAADATAFAHRDAQFAVMVSNFSTNPAGDAEAADRTEQMWQALRPYAAGVYVNFLGGDGAERIHEAYPPATYARLAALKAQYDPANLFHLNQNIAPKAPGF